MQRKMVFQTLAEGGFLSDESATVLWKRCRDQDIVVFEDQKTGIIYLDPTHEGNPADYYQNKSVPSSPKPRNDMDVADSERRDKLLQPLIANKRWLDFGCGPGHQLRKSHGHASDYLGAELNLDNIESLQNDGHPVSASHQTIIDFKPQVISMFHVLEHLDDPVSQLSSLLDVSAPDTRLIVEIPHARDWLIHSGPESFKDFTFWSEHLVLHTRESLSYVLQTSGWIVDDIIGVQRYPVSNHLAWFQLDKPTGLNNSSIDDSSRQLANAYQAYLAARNQTDTLIALARSNP